MYLENINGWVIMDDGKMCFHSPDWRRMLPDISAAESVMEDARRFRGIEAPVFVFDSPCPFKKGRNYCWDSRFEEWESYTGPVFEKVSDFQYKRRKKAYTGQRPTMKMVEKAREIKNDFFHFRGIPV